MRYQWFERGAYASQKARRYLDRDFNPDNVKKIAVIRHAALGDQVITRPFLIEARKFFPNAEITLVAVSNYLYGMPDDLVDRVHIMPGKDKKNETSVLNKIRNIKSLGEQDIIFDLASTNRSHWMMALSKAKLKIGFPYKSYLRGVLFNVTVPRSDFQAEVENLLDMLRFLGHSPINPPDFGYPDHRKLQDKQSPYVLYFNGASQQSKILSQQQMRGLMEQAITDNPTIRHIFLEGKNDFEKGEYLRELCEQHSNFSIQPSMVLDELVVFIAKSSLLVAPDTGIRNIAISTHTPTIGIFYSTVPFRYTPLYEKHSIVMNSDGAVPSNEQICSILKQEINDIQGKK